MAKPGKNQQPKKDTSVTNQSNTANAPLASDIASANAAQDPNLPQQTTDDSVKDPAKSAGGATQENTGEQLGGAGDAGQGDESASQDNTTEQTPEPTPAPTPAPAPAPTSAPAVAGDVLREKSDFEQYLDAIRANGSVNLVTALDLLINYQNVMGLNTVTTAETINQQQGALWRAIRSIINSPEDFEKGFQMLINIFRQYGGEGAFQHHLLFRGFEHTKLNAETSRAFQSILTIITTAAESKSSALVRKNIDLARALQSSAFTDEARMRVIGFFN